MIPVFLQDTLEKRVGEVFAHQTFKNATGEQVPLNIFKQHLPQKASDDVSLFPYVIIQLNEGSQGSEEEAQSVSLLFVVGVFDDENTYQGYRDVANILQSIYADLKRGPVVNGQFELKYPIRWRIHDEDVFPFYFGGLETSWEAPNITRDDVEAMI